MSPQNFTHVLMLDADAALVKHSMDILGVLAQTLPDVYRRQTCEAVLNAQRGIPRG